MNFTRLLSNFHSAQVKKKFLKDLSRLGMEGKGGWVIWGRGDKQATLFLLYIKKVNVCVNVSKQAFNLLERRMSEKIRNKRVPSLS